MPGPVDTTLRCERPVAADATSLALLLAGPAALDRWPGVECDEHAPGRVTIRIGHPSAVTTEALLQRVRPRSARVTSYLLRFTVTGGALPRLTAC